MAAYVPSQLLTVNIPETVCMYIQETVVPCMDIKGALDLYYRGQFYVFPEGAYRATKQEHRNGTT